MDDTALEGLLGWFGTPQLREKMHRHSDIELNFVVRGRMRSLIGGVVQELHAEELSVFWAATPHRTTDYDAQTLLGVIHIPLLEFLRWDVPANLRDPLLLGQPLLHRGDPVMDELLFRRWAQDLQIGPLPIPNPSPESHRAVFFEVQGRLHRLAKMLGTYTEVQDQVRIHELSKPEQLVRLLAEQHSSPVELTRLAQQAGLHPNYAMNLFRESFGMTMVQYLTHHRVAHAQRLLISSDLSVLEVALDAGFSSVSHFYTMFKRSSGVSPRRYRTLHHGPNLTNNSHSM